MTRIFFRDTLLPLLVFPTLSYFAYQYTVGRGDLSGLATKLSSQCPIPGVTLQPSPYALTYTGVPPFDAFLCIVVAFFHEAMSPGDPHTFLQYFIGVAPILVLVPAIEGFRPNRSVFIAFPVLFGLLSQVFTIGAITPLYWLVFFLSGGRARFDNTSPITKAHAEAVIFGLFAGAAIPSICMVMMQDPTITAIWQLYPVCVSIASFLHLAIRRPNYSHSGFGIIQVLYLAAFVLTSSLHFAVLWSRRGDISTLKALLIPSLTPLVDADAPIQAMDFLKWDFTFAFLSMGIAQLWFVSDIIEIPFILFWFAIAVPFCGPGAAVVAANLWREGQIGDRVAIVKEKQS